MSWALRSVCFSFLLKGACCTRSCCKLHVPMESAEARALRIGRKRHDMPSEVLNDAISSASKSDLLRIASTWGSVGGSFKNMLPRCPSVYHLEELSTRISLIQFTEVSSYAPS